ncbi:DsbC family protein [Noviherbaspirillum galbum]|uniref:DsbC family protein n=1 Tax=Noviherbaspirillum galbum TaxID=2709383 RepID=UPI002E2C555E|nr:DsbC family protein [Noviherbaspirillum galbum]
MIRRTLVAALAAVVLPSAFAVDSATDSLIRARMAGEGATVKGIQPSPIAGLFEVALTDNTIVYVSRDGQFAIVGEMIDLVKKMAVTRERTTLLAAADFPALPHQLTIKSGQIGAKTKVMVVADPNCPYCHSYYKKLKATPDIEISTLLVAILGADSQQKAMSILCAADPVAAYEASINGTVPTPARCESGEKTLRASFEWMKTHPVKTTPTSYFNDGSLEVGELSVDSIKKHMFR